jgi:hypothetical protein
VIANWSIFVLQVCYLCNKNKKTIVIKKCA